MCALAGMRSRPHFGTEKSEAGNLRGQGGVFGKKSQKAGSWRLPQDEEVPDGSDSPLFLGTDEHNL